MMAADMSPGELEMFLWHHGTLRTVHSKQADGEDPENEEEDT